jgi:hypothetical protein
MGKKVNNNYTLNLYRITDIEASYWGSVNFKYYYNNSH